MSDTSRSPVRILVWIVSLALAGIGLYWIVDGFAVDGEWRIGNPALPAGAHQPRQVRAEVTSRKGAVGVNVGDECVFLVEKLPLPGQRFQCRAQVMCGGQLLYGGSQRGYFSCALPDTPRRDVIGTDPATTRVDGDASMQLDTVRGLLSIRDDQYGPSGAFSVEAEVLEVR